MPLNLIQLKTDRKLNKGRECKVAGNLLHMRKYIFCIELLPKASLVAHKLMVFQVFLGLIQRNSRLPHSFLHNFATVVKVQLYSRCF